MIDWLTFWLIEWLITWVSEWLLHESASTINEWIYQWINNPVQRLGKYVQNCTEHNHHKNFLT